MAPITFHQKNDGHNHHNKKSPFTHAYLRKCGPARSHPPDVYLSTDVPSSRISVDVPGSLPGIQHIYGFFQRLTEYRTGDVIPLKRLHSSLCQCGKFLL